MFFSKRAPPGAVSWPYERSLVAMAPCGRFCERRARVLLDGRLVYQTAYQQPVGPIRGIVYNFRGGGSVDYIRLYNAGNELAYADEFNR